LFNKLTIVKARRNNKMALMSGGGLGKLILGILIGVALPVLAGSIFLFAGGMPVATKGPPLPMERFIAKTALHSAIRDSIGKSSPITADEQNLLGGAKIYSVHCAVCHGLVEAKMGAISQGLFPKPPHLLRPDKGVTDDPIGETYWKVKNGIRLTGMPGFVDSLSETELWQVSELLLNADKLPKSVNDALATKN
jgi:thiosulfate dehydrogenase